MILVCKAAAIPQFLPYVRRMVDREAERGDQLDYESLSMELMSGAQRLCLVYADEHSEEPVMMFVVQDVWDNSRKEFNLVINHFYAPSRTAVGLHDFTEDKSAFHSLVSMYKRVLFVTNNPALVEFINRIGLEVKPAYTIYEFERTE